MRVLLGRIVAGAAVTFFAAGAASAAITLDFGENAFSTEGTGASGRVVLSFANEASDVRVSAEVTNTTGNPIFGAGATQSKLTAFGFDLVSGVSYITGTFTAGAYFDELILNASASPFGTLDVAGADNDNYNGGNANGALPQGLTDTFSVRLATILDAIGLESAFLTAFTTDPVLTTALRFQQVNAGAGSDKMTNPTMSPVPVPPAALSLLLGFGGLGLIRTLRERYVTNRRAAA